MSTGVFVPWNPDRWKRYPQSAKVGWITDAKGCDIWQGAKSESGYGVVSFRGRMQQAHRARYIREIGPIPEGLVLDHYACDNGPGGCCNPHHCRPVTTMENVLRSDGEFAWKKARTHCPKGHPLTEGNLVGWHLRRGRRKCKACRNERNKKRGRERYKEMAPKARAQLIARTNERARQRLAERRKVA